MVEEWRNITGYEGLYQVSNLGRIKSVRGTKIIKQKNKYGYKQVTLHKEGKRKYVAVHRIVAQEFIPNPDNKPEVNHIDANKSNNVVHNLEWVTRKENMQHASCNGLIVNPNGTAIAVIMDDRIKFDSMEQCAKFIGVKRSEIRKAALGAYKTVHGHTFRILNK